MNINREFKNELNALSRQVFGSESRWVKLVEKGYSAPITEEISEWVTDHTGRHETKKLIQAKNKGLALTTTKRFTPETIRDFMLAQKVKIDETNSEYLQKLENDRKSKETEKLKQLVSYGAAGSANNT